MPQDNGAGAQALPHFPTLRVTEIGEFIRYQSCERRFKLGLSNRALARRLPFSERLFNTLDPVLQEVGREAENAWERRLQEQALVDLTRIDDRPEDQRATPWADFAAAVANLAVGQAAYGREISITGQIGQFSLSGNIDFIAVLWDGEHCRIRAVECKASRKDKTYHRIQLGAYVLLLRQQLSDAPLIISNHEYGPDVVEGVVARIDEITNEPQDIIQRSALRLEIEEADLVRLLSRDGSLASIVHRDLVDVEFMLDTKCDSCVFSVDCFPDSALQRKLELLSLPPSATRALHNSGVNTIDDLAGLDPASDQATRIRQTDGFDSNLPQLIAKASARRSTLPRGDADPLEFQVRALPHAGQGQLPAHEQNDQRLVRVYLSVDYDYAENRIGALSAHVTISDQEIQTPFDAETRQPEPRIVEALVEQDEAGHRNVIATGPLGAASRDVIRFKTHPWTGINEQDTAAEREIIQGFLDDLIDAIGEVAEAQQAPIHFYVWSRSEIAQLVEGCSRASSMLLSHLRELLGCRESLEQLIFSCLQDEVDTRYALGWTGRGLTVASSLIWFGQRYHWRRRISGETVNLDRVFEQDLFDFKTTLALTAEGNWARNDEETDRRHRFEIRSRFHDTLSAPYWRAHWRTLPDPDTVRDQRVRTSIQRYNRITETVGLLRGYLIARVHALRWIEERVRFKNEEIRKPPLPIAELQQFRLGVDNTGRAAVDFLRLDHHVKLTDWLAQHIQPPAGRVQTGRTIPVRNIRSRHDRLVEVEFNLDEYGLSAEEFSLRSTISDGAFVRLSPHNGNPEVGQTIGQLVRGGITCTVQQIDWENNSILLSAVFSRASDYILGSRAPGPDEDLFDFATIDESVSDFVAGRVEGRLLSGLGMHMFNWFDPENPTIPARNPLSRDRQGQIAETLNAWTIPSTTFRLRREQQEVITDGLASRVQLLQGPPGTGKTVTTAASTLSQCICRLQPGAIVLVGANTHTAVDTILKRLAAYHASFRAEARRQGLAAPNLIVTKVNSSNPPPDANGIQNFAAKPCVTRVNQWCGQGVLIVGGTTSALLKMASELCERNPFARMPQRFQADMLVVDEASMMVFPHFLALATLVRADGNIILAGDNRQLAPIIAHDWENEDRPPAQLYQPFRSSYDAIRRIIVETDVTPASARLSQLTFTLRLPPIIRDLISRIYRDLDDIDLEGPEAVDVPAAEDVATLEDWEQIWGGPHALHLIVHSERESRQSNTTEASIIEQLLGARRDHEPDSIAVITPHRAQRAFLRERLEPFAEFVTVIDTVERLQGGERPIIIVSATASDPNAISSAASFILNLNRANVAFSRTQERLIVVCANTLLDHVPAELEDYENALLWKSVRQLCTNNIAITEVDGHSVRILTPELRDEG